MIIVGSGAIELNLLSFYNAMGTEVTIVEFMPNIVPVEDEDISKQMERSMKSRCENHDKLFCRKIDTELGVKAFVKTAKGEVVLEADMLLSAVGIKTNIEKHRIRRWYATDKDILVNAYNATNIPGYYALATLRQDALAHVASAEGINCGENCRTACRITETYRL
jgi:dihydrolipoamide dehydrogenase